MKPAEYELKLIFVIMHGANYPKQPVYSNKWLVEEVNILSIQLFIRVEWDNKAAQVTKTHMNLFLPTASL